MEQGGRKYCLGNSSGSLLEEGTLFQTKPDIILRRDGKIEAIIDTKWKKLASNPLDRKHGVAQADVYQLMAYARLYRCRNLLLLYPEVPGMLWGERKLFGIAKGDEMLRIATIGVSQLRATIELRLKTLWLSSPVFVDQTAPSTSGRAFA